MKSDSHPLVAAFIVLILFGGSLAVCFWPQDEEESDFTVTGTVIGISSYNQPKLDVKADVLFDEGLGYGDLFTIETPERSFENAILVTGYQGIFMFDTFVNVESDGYISVGFFGKLIVAEEGAEITLMHTGTSERYQNTPLYNGGYTNNRDDYASDAEFANFFEVTGGDLKPGILYRSFSPLYDPAKQARSTYVNEQAEAVGIQYEVALSYSDATVTAAVEALDGYCLTLCEEGNYVAPAMNYLYFQQKDRTKLVLESILDEDGSYLVHCNVGRDRTGFVVLLIQSLCGCTEEEMKACEVQAFCNLYTIELESLEYETISYCTYDRNMFLIANPDKIDDMFDIDWENIDVNSVDTFSASYSYCTDYLGMAQEDVDRLIDKLCVGGEL